jgi:ketosteroid isomerase-like protein
MNEHPNAERFRRLYQAYNDVAAGRGGVETIRDMLAEDLVWHVPGRGPFSGDRDKAAVMAGFEGVVPGFSEEAERAISRFDIQIEGTFATDEWVFMRVHWDHTRDGLRFDQHGVEVCRLDRDGRIVEFWALMSDTEAFDEFFS